MEQIYGYARVSTKEQNEARQLTALREMGIPSENVYLDKQSGADFERVQYRRMLRRLGPGDTLIVKSIDRLGRNYTEILEQWRIITKNKRAAIVILDMPLLDTRQNRDLTGQLIADIVLQLLSYVAQTEREFIRQRQAEGISAARERGVRFGRDPAGVPAGLPRVARKKARLAGGGRAVGRVTDDVFEVGKGGKSAQKVKIKVDFSFRL